MIQPLKDESHLTEEEQKQLRFMELTGSKKVLAEIVAKELEKKRQEEEKAEREENPKSIDDIPAFRGGAFNYGKKKISDRDLASATRRLALKKIFNLLCMERGTLSPAELDLYSKILVKLAGAVLPRIQEITGEDGEQLTIHIAREIADKNKIGTTEEEPKQLEEGKENDEEGADD